MDMDLDLHHSRAWRMEMVLYGRGGQATNELMYELGSSWTCTAAYHHGNAEDKSGGHELPRPAPCHAAGRGDIKLRHPKRV
jgi:hypothetical protein